MVQLILILRLVPYSLSSADYEHHKGKYCCESQPYCVFPAIVEEFVNNSGEA
jgi:hypothetical protein